MDELDGIAAADAHLGRPVPLPAVALPLTRWGRVSVVSPDGVEVEWNLDDTRAGAPGRLALYVGYAPAVELSWRAHGLHLRLTAQGPWEPSRLVEIAESVG
jgi:hypothetical protein